jgi:hypothetical protein
MNTITCRLALIAVLAVAFPAAADDPTAAKKAPESSVLNPNADPSMRPAGQMVGKVVKSTDGSLTLKGTQMESHRSGRRTYLRPVEKDVEYTLASDAKVRWQNLPKKADGTQYTDKEYKALREPAGTPGYKGENSDLKAGQIVRLYLSKGAKDSDPVVTTVLIVTDAPKHDDKNPNKK